MTLRPLWDSLGILIVAAIALAVTVAPASAIVTNTPGGRASYVPLNGAPLGGASPLHAAEPLGSPPLVWHGGPVMHSQAEYTIFWAPGGETEFPSGYINSILDFLENVASDSGKPSNVYSVSAQYTDGSGYAGYSESPGEAVIDEDPYPTSETCPPYEGLNGAEYTSCISDAKLTEEVEAEVEFFKWPQGLSAEYYVVLPPEVGSCFGTVAESGCFDEEFCAYHGFIEGPELVYANISYSPGDVFGCGVGEYPNGHANGNVDDTLSSLSHEANESITDPELNAWFDSKGFENGDECRNTKDHDDFGKPLGGPSGSLFNQVIGSAHYYLQQEWSNETGACQQRVEPAQPSIADPGETLVNEAISFDGSGSVPGTGGITKYSWDFGDGGTASGPTPSHTFTAVGVYPVTLTVTDSGLTYSTERQLTVIPQPTPPTVTDSPATGVTDTSASLNGTVNPQGRKTTYRFEYGTTTAYGSVTPVAGAGAGAGIGDKGVSAGLTGLAPSTTYHFRLSATNVVNTATTADRTFRTPATPTLPVTPLPKPTPPPSVGTAVVVGVGVVKGGSALLKVNCQGAGACKGTLELLVRLKAHKHAGTLRKSQAIGRASFSIAAGASAKLSIKLSSLGKSLIQAAGKKGLKVTLSGSGVTGRSLVLKKG